MKKEDYDLLTEKEKVFVDILLEISADLKKLTQDISRDLEDCVVRK